MLPPVAAVTYEALHGLRQLDICRQILFDNGG